MEHVLTSPPDPDAAALAALMGERRSVRTYSGAPVDRQAMMDLLWAAQGIAHPSGARTVPSAGAHYPLRVYLAAGRVSGVVPGLHAYTPDPPALMELGVEDVLGSLEAAALEDQPWVGTAAAVLVVTADLPRMAEAFAAQAPRGERGARYAYMETGALAQNVQLMATALALGSVIVGGFDDDAVRASLALPATETPTALLCVGVPAAGDEAAS